ncbi:ABC transporter permease [Demequina pelophila]|uniref:ABC transporter permease n=1 Tax=Demequina pelophila TaxID=1638984 RepID=UPI000B0A3CFE|nr:ABC transporter permease subunit [Demequina pelophila]
MSAAVATAATESGPAQGGPRGRARSWPTGLRRGAVHASVFAALMLTWWGVTAASLIDPLFLPGPAAVWQAFVDANTCHPVNETSSRIVCGAQNYFLWEHLLASLQRIAIGVSAAVAFGVLLGFLMGTMRGFGMVLEPYLNFLRALPPLGYIGLLIVWFGIGDVSKIWLLFLAAFPPITMATIAGVRGIHASRIHAVESLGASRWQVLVHVVFPSTLPGVISGVRIAVGFAWTTVVAAELNNGIPGIGGLAYVAGTQLQTPLVIACIIVIGLAAIALDSALKLLGAVAVPWYGKAKA